MRDARRWDLFDRVFTEDARTDFGGPAGWSDLSSLKRDFEAIHRPFEATLHVTTNHQVVVNGDRIKARSCRTVWSGGNPAVLQTMPGVSGEQQLDSLSREAAAGRIAHLTAYAIVRTR